MSDATADSPEPSKRRFPVVPAALLCLLAAGGGFAFVTLDPLGLLPQEVAEDGVAAEPAPVLPGQAAFIPLEPLLITLAPGARADHLRFGATLDVAPGSEAHVRALLPRVTDVLATYLRAVEPAMLDRPGALFVMRAQMLRRIALVVGPEQVNDLLVTEFILN